MKTDKSEQHLFESLLAKFIINLPPEELEDSSRIAYQMEKAFYFYVDNVLCLNQVREWQKQRNQFVGKMAQYAPSSIRIDPRKIGQKITVSKPVCGAIVFNRDSTKILVIRVRGKLGFPKGKWNQHQSASECAAREVQQQTGVYIHNCIDPNIQIEFQSHGSSTHFFVARGVSEDDRLKRDAKEIDDIFWMRVDDIKANISRFVERSRTVWEHFMKIEGQPVNIVSKAAKFQNFLVKYAPKEALEIPTDNPFLNFKFDRQALRRALLDGLEDGEYTIE